mgnify:CR=1 FL=1
MNKTVATWNGQVIAESDHCISVEGNAYFPPSSLKQEFFKPSAHSSVCPWKGDCNYFDVVVGGESNANAAWVDNNPKAAPASIKDYVAFWKGFEVRGAETARPMA